MRYWVGLCLFILSLPLYAVQVNGLYTAQVVVDDQSQTLRNKAIAVAFNLVLQKASGRTSVLQSPLLQTETPKFSSYVEQFQYQKMADEQTGYLLSISFQKTAIDRFLQRLDVPVWGSNRPDILVWLSLEQAGRVQLVGADSEQWNSQLTQIALDSGLAITLPLLDLADQQAITTENVWQASPETIELASQRYGAKQVIVAYMKGGTNASKQFDWKLINANGEYVDALHADTLEAAFRMSLAKVSERLADIYAPRGSTGEAELSLVLKGVNTLEQFIDVTQYLSSLDMVKRLEWKSMRTDTLELKLNISGEEAVFKKMIALNHVLSPDAAQVPTVAKVVEGEMQIDQGLNRTLYYRIN
ncbi:MAG: DUF2066 domain-containing protein [Cycloclasticus sp.]|nr:DUF2066 domain-containing protein [Cycloclasticus sp.]MBQ0790565.1 DUF2066 domain-containing protein [Cycloclasticus sp.]